ncbi:MAG: ADP-forming succinate--CoA ligase subunit beta [Candidatus Krumholzibacteriia bacterium]
MNLHEYQARDLLRRHDLPVPAHVVASTPEEVAGAARELGTPVVVKAQVHAGGRGKAGGVKLASSVEEARAHAESILGMRIKNLEVRKVLVATAVDIEQEIYVGITLDRAAARPVLMLCAEGGVEIEEVARRSPEQIVRCHLDPVRGLQPFEARRVSFQLLSDTRAALGLARICTRLATAFTALDASLAEINPLVITKGGELLALDAKINLDDNGLARHAELESLRDLDAEDAGERKARSKGLSYIHLDGDVACVVNGAGLAMATMDLIQHYGGRPANFLDIGGSSNPEKVTTALEIIQSDSHVRAILFNIFGGITRCDDVAQGLLQVTQTHPPRVPIIVRLIGTNEDRAREILDGTSLQTAVSMDEVVQRAIAAARGSKETV